MKKKLDSNIKSVSVYIICALELSPVYIKYSIFNFILLLKYLALSCEKMMLMMINVQIYNICYEIFIFNQITETRP